MTSAQTAKIVQGYNVGKYIKLSVYQQSPVMLSCGVPGEEVFICLPPQLVPRYCFNCQA